MGGTPIVDYDDFIFLSGECLMAQRIQTGLEGDSRGTGGNDDRKLHHNEGINRTTGRKESAGGSML